MKFAKFWRTSIWRTSADDCFSSSELKQGGQGTGAGSYENPPFLIKTLLITFELNTCKLNPNSAKPKNNKENETSR